MAKRKNKNGKTGSTKTNPKHYLNKKIEPIEYIEANNLGFHEGNIIKYITRYKEKDEMDDLFKAQWYIQRLISMFYKYGQGKNKAVRSKK